MQLASTALVLTVAYIVLLAVNQPVAVEVTGFYLIAVCVLIGAQRARCWWEDHHA